MRVRVVLAAACCLIAVVACSASRQAKPDLPAPEYEPARALPAASGAASAAQPVPEAEEADDADGFGTARGRIGGAESAGKPKLEEAAKPDLGGGESVPAKPISKDKADRKTHADRPEPAASPEAPPSPTTIPAQPAPVPAR